jgi:rod shape-determining protein MreD
VQTLKIALTIFIALLVEMLLSKRLSFFQYLDLPLLITVYFSLQRAPVLGMLTGAAAGIAGDAVDGGVLGTGGFTKTLLGYIIAILSIKFPLQNPLARIAVVAVASITSTIIYVGLNLMLDREIAYVANWIQFGRVLGWKTLADTLASVPVFFILDRAFPEQPAASRMAIKKRFYE